MRVLIAFPSASELVEGIEEQLDWLAEERHVKRVSVVKATSASSAMRALALDQFTHCIVHDELPENRNSSPEPGSGFACARRMRAFRKKLSISYFYERTGLSESELDEIESLDLKRTRNTGNGLRRLAERVFDMQTEANPIEITIDLSNGPYPRYQILSDELPPEEREGKLTVHKDHMRSFIRLSQDIENDDDWSGALEALADSLRTTIITSNVEFKSALRLALRAEDAADRSRLQFRVEQHQFDVAFEAIRYLDTDALWMLCAPVYRSLAGTQATPGLPLFRDDPINCLIILSPAAGRHTYKNADGSVVGNTAEYGDLKHARSECEELEKLFAEVRRKTEKIGKVVVIGAKSPLDERELIETLSRQRWHLVHYIGHTDYIEYRNGEDSGLNRDGDARGVMLLPGKSPGKVVPVDIKNIAPHLEKTRFVYFSSCLGTKLPFVRRLAVHNVPGVLGFRSKVRDDLAFQHALYFYRRLFDLGSIERAFCASRKHFHDTPETRGDRLWACASLVMQRA